MTDQQIIEQHLEAATNRAYFMGAIFGLAGGFVAGVLLFSPIWPQLV